MRHSHMGHRERLRQRACAEGLDSFQPHEVLELLLFPVLPQRDVNPLAHALIDRFGSVGGVLNAPVEALAEVRGIGGQSASWLALLGEVSGRYRSLAMEQRPRIQTFRQMVQHCSGLFERVDREQVWLFSMGTSGRLLGSTLLGECGQYKADLLRPAVEPLIYYHAKYAVLVQWRNPGNVALEEGDVEAAGRLARLLSHMDVMLMDSIILSRHTAVSIRRERGSVGTDGQARAMAERNSLYERWLDE